MLLIYNINFIYMDDMLESKFLDIQLNELLKSQIENPFIQAL